MVVVFHVQLFVFNISFKLTGFHFSVLTGSRTYNCFRILNLKLNMIAIHLQTKLC